jgi:hypothetical protein
LSLYSLYELQYVQQLIYGTVPQQENMSDISGNYGD